MQRYAEGDSGTSSGSSGKGSNNRNLATYANLPAGGYPREARSKELFSTRQRQMNPYIFPEPRTPPGKRNPLGKHRLRVELNRLNQEIELLREELKAIDNTPPASKACKELVDFMETCADPLLPITPGPVMVEWDRWFRRPVQQSRSCCW